MSSDKIFLKNPFKILISFLIIWIVLFQFVFVWSNILPKPIILWESINDILQENQLVNNFLISVGSITFGIIVSLILTYFLRYFLLTKNLFVDLISAFYKLKFLLPTLIFIIFLVFWIPNSFYTEYILLAFFSFLYISKDIINKRNTILNDLENSARSLGLTSKKILANVKFKQIIPSLENSFLLLHIKLWGLLLVFEYVQNTFGLGSVLHSSMILKDLYVLFFTSVLISLTIIIFHFLIKVLFNQFVHWE